MSSRFLPVLLAATLIAPPIVAADLEVPVLPIDMAGLPADDEALTLDLRDAYEMALARNMDLQIGRFDLATAGAAIHASAGIFDPYVGGSASISTRESPAATDLAGADITVTDNEQYGLRLDQLLPSGTQLFVQGGANYSDTNSIFYFLNPRWDIDLTAGVTQPLLQGFGTVVNRSGIIVARANRGQAAHAFETSVVDTLRQVESAYWDLVAAREAVDVEQESLELAERLLAETRERIRVGTSAPIDAVQSEAGVASRRESLIYARNAAANAEDTLKALLGFDDATEWMMSIRTTEPLEAEPLESGLRSAIDTALAERPELAQQGLRIEVLEHNQKLARNRTLPTVDLEATYGYGGVGGDFTDEDPAGVPVEVRGGFRDAVEQIGDRDFPHWEVGLMFSYPFGNNEAQGVLAQRRFELARGKAEMRALQQDIILQVRTAVRALADGAAAMDAAEASRRLAERNLEAETTKFENGLSTNFQVLEIQEDLAQARLAELRARTNYRKAIIGYRVATGTLLEQRGVSIADPGQPDVPHDYWADVEWLQFTDLRDVWGDDGEEDEPTGVAGDAG